MLGDKDHTALGARPRLCQGRCFHDAAAWRRAILDFEATNGTNITEVIRRVMSVVAVSTAEELEACADYHAQRQTPVRLLGCETRMTGVDRGSAGLAAGSPIQTGKSTNMQVVRKERYGRARGTISRQGKRIVRVEAERDQAFDKVSELMLEADELRRRLEQQTSEPPPVITEGLQNSGRLPTGHRRTQPTIDALSQVNDI